MSDWVERPNSAPRKGFLPSVKTELAEAVVGDAPPDLDEQLAGAPVLPRWFAFLVVVLITAGLWALLGYLALGVVGD